MAFSINPLGETLGAEIVGFDVRRDATPEAAEELKAAWLEHVVFCFRDQDLSPAEFLTLAGLFGKPKVQPLQRSEYQVEGFPEIRVLSNRHLDIHGDRKPIKTGGSWHSDHSHQQDAPRGTMLHSLQLPSHGGNTSFTNQHAAYKGLPADQQEMARCLRVHHIYNSPYAPRKMQKLSAEEQKHAAPEAWHPLARPHPADPDRLAIFLNPIRTICIEGMSEEDSQVLLNEMLEHSTQPQYCYSHQWRQGDVLIWDNPQALHMVDHDYPPDELRLMHRTLVQYA